MQQEFMQFVKILLQNTYTIQKWLKYVIIKSSS